MRKHAGEASGFLDVISNKARLLILCHLIEATEMSVGEMADRVGLSQSALSQHLAKLREAAFVDTRRQGQTVFYRVCDPRAARVLALLHEFFCTGRQRSISKNSPSGRSLRSKGKKG
jgi:DNA-binding transcriptional ArsR family regulator